MESLRCERRVDAGGEELKIGTPRTVLKLEVANGVTTAIVDAVGAPSMDAALRGVASASTRGAVLQHSAAVPSEPHVR
jgi:hypothetical protein